MLFMNKKSRVENIKRSRIIYQECTLKWCWDIRIIDSRRI